MHRSLHVDTQVTRTLDADLLRSWPLTVEDGGDKFSRGTVLVIGGSASTPGAVLLAGVASLRMGAGRLQIATASEVAVAVAVAAPEAMVVPIDVTDAKRAWSDKAFESSGLGDLVACADVILVGPGLAPSPGIPSLVEHVIRTSRDDATIVLDACALTSFSRVDPDVRDTVRNRLLMTPNRQELDDLGLSLGITAVDAPTEHDMLRAVAEALGAVLTSFGRVQSAADRCWQHDSNHPGLGTSGSGDVLAGLVAGAAARTADGAQAVCWATFAHMEAGARLGNRVGELGYLARELLSEIPACLPRPAPAS